MLWLSTKISYSPEASGGGGVGAESRGGGGAVSFGFTKKLKEDSANHS